MKKLTLLEMVQNIASALDSDEVNSITDTTESLQIAEVIKETFYEQFNNIYVPELQRLFSLQSVSNLLSPTYLKIPADVDKIMWLRYKDYRQEDRFRLVDYVSPEEFLETQLQYSQGYNNVSLTIDPSSGVEYYVTNNSPPTTFTMFDDQYIAFNSFDAEYQDTVLGVDAIGYGTKAFEFSMEDNFVPPLDGNLFPLLLSESKATCFLNLRQVSAPKEERRASRQRIRMQNDQFKARQAQLGYWRTGNDFSRRR